MTAFAVVVMVCAVAMATIVEGSAYTTVKTNAMCSPSDTYGLTRRLDLKTLEECAQAARDAGVNLFVACQNSRFFCYIYTKTRYSTTCASEHNSNKCNVYKVAGAPLSTIAYTTFKAKAVCSPSSTYGLTRRHDLKTLEECAQATGDAGVNLFVACQSSRFFCYFYAKTQSSATCATEHNSRNCNVYKVTIEEKKKDEEMDQLDGNEVNVYDQLDGNEVNVYDQEDEVKDQWIGEWK